MTGRRGPRIASVLTGFVLTALYAPIALVVVNSFNADERLASWGGVTFRWWVEAMNDTRILEDLWLSLIVASATTILSVSLALADALWWRRASSRARRLLDGVVFARIVLPEVVLALGLFLGAEQFGVPLGIAAIVIGQAVFCSAYATVLIQARLSTMGTELEDAAADLGAPPGRILRGVTLPVLAPSVLAAGLMVLTFSLDDVVVAQFLGGTEAETLPVLLLGKIRLTVSPEINAIGTALMLVTALPVIFLLSKGRLTVPGRRGRPPEGPADAS
ncbi:ABC transporter permease [Amycolatopsis sp. EV170708-02-1]|uniref:ABC transporter permease n=1 Tax=Amycolatopsis sp. EV170708-02-1 TaxID=2919322 RepID=UPI001F0C1A10|nr:ABC transporter permease [Amycolatopsis sp. EV170708-02-1]UMP06922.1 ABC transporter permease [Amycolatopsis sp. EV170708-02-1]